MKTETSKVGTEGELRLPLNPVPASRPRVTKWGTYYAKTYKNWMKEAHDLIPQAGAPWDGHLSVMILFVVKKPKTTKRTNPRGDIDNYLKGILDAMTKRGYWHDDDQITTINANKRFANEGEEPHIQVYLEPTT